MKIDIWMDFVCPYCYLGQHRLKEALAMLDSDEAVELFYHSYELEPRAQRHSGKSMPMTIADRHGIDLESAEASTDDLREQGLELGLDINPRLAMVTNTHDAHRLVSYAVTENNDIAFRLIERLFQAYFTELKDIGDPSLLVDLAVEAGLDREAVIEVLVSEAFHDKVVQDRKKAGEVELQGVPHFVINDRFTISGAQHPRSIAAFLKKVQSGAKDS